VHESLAEIQTPSHWNLIGRSTSFPSQAVIAQQYYSATFDLIALSFPQGKTRLFSNTLFFKFLLFKKLCNSKIV
jgi:hypothetical protein